MNFFKSAALSFVMLSSLASAKVALEAAIVDNGAMITIPVMTLELNQPEVKFVDGVRFEATLTESNTVVFDLAFQNEEGNYVSFLQPELVLTEKETKATLESVNKNGDQLVLLVIANEITE